MLTVEQVNENAETYLKQFKIVDRDRTEIRPQSEWFDALQAHRGVVQLAGKFTVAQMMERDDFAQRFKQGTPSASTSSCTPPPGLRLSRRQCRRRVRRHRPEVQPDVGRELQPMFGQPAQAIFSRPAPGRYGRPRQDEQVRRQLHCPRGASQRDVRQGHVHPRPPHRRLLLTSSPDVPDEDVAVIRQSIEKRTQNPMEHKLHACPRDRDAIPLPRSRGGRKSPNSRVSSAPASSRRTSRNGGWFRQRPDDGRHCGSVCLLPGSPPAVLRHAASSPRVRSRLMAPRVTELQWPRAAGHDHPRRQTPVPAVGEGPALGSVGAGLPCPCRCQPVCQILAIAVPFCQMADLPADLDAAVNDQASARVALNIQGYEYLARGSG